MKKTKPFISRFALVILNIVVATLNLQAQSSDFHVVDFGGTNGSSPNYTSLVSDSTYLYGMTTYGGSSNFGTIFKVKPDGTGDSILLNFNSETNGKYPFGSLLYDGKYLYGMTNRGGANDSGTVFKIRPDGTGYSTLLHLSDTIGTLPNGSLMSDGTYLYGMAVNGGKNKVGTIFKIKPDGSGYAKVFDFDGTSGSIPFGDLIYDGTFLYGMTSNGGTYNYGTIFKIKPDGTAYTKVLDFNGANGRYPKGSLFYDGTFLYGMTFEGGDIYYGNIFKIKPNGTGYTNLLYFNGTNGNQPYGSLISDGTFLYGMTSTGGRNDHGIIFRIKSDGTAYSDLFDFDGTNGNTPYGSLLSDGTFLYGMTSTGGNGQSSNGTLFKFNPHCSSVILTSASGTDAQTICSKTSITNITYQFSGTNAHVSGLPKGLISSLSGNVFTISGTPDTTGYFAYTVTTTGAKGCSPDSSSAGGTININSLPTATIAGSTTLCKGVQSPNITFNGYNGNTPYTFTYNINGGENQTITVIVTPGDHQAETYAHLPVPTDIAGTFIYSLVSVSDSASISCSQKQSGKDTVVIGVPVSILSTNQSTSNVCDGYLEVSVKSAAPYIYKWSDNVINSPYRHNVCSGNYKVIVTDTTTKCVDSAYAYVGIDKTPSSANPLVLSVSSNDASNNILCNGIAKATVKGGTPPYNIFFSANTVHTSPYVIGQLCPGFYTINATDAQSNSASFIFVVGSPSTSFPHSNPAYHDSAIVDTLVASALQNCAINYGAIDSNSIRITDFTLIGHDSISVVWTIYQGATVVQTIKNVQYGNIKSPGVYVVVLDLFCTNRTSGSVRASDEIDINNRGTVGIAPISGEDNSVVYPNPFTNKLNIEVEKISVIKITDISGKEVYAGTVSSGKLTIDTGNLTAGVYFITIINDQTIITKKLIKN